MFVGINQSSIVAIVIKKKITYDFRHCMGEEKGVRTRPTTKDARAWLVFSMHTCTRGVNGTYVRIRYGPNIEHSIYRRYYIVQQSGMSLLYTYVMFWHQNDGPYVHSFMPSGWTCLRTISTSTCKPLATGPGGKRGKKLLDDRCTTAAGSVNNHGGTVGFSRHHRRRLRQ